ncbi:hypothetical protein, partial [Limnohabitans sp.]|uniref:hypothetical protein n=1 Tax=Limnohabitans sp. TaxID=1907725 RepID=UPI0037C0CD17
ARAGYSPHRSATKRGNPVHFPSLRAKRGNPVPSHALHRHPHLLIREKKVCGDAGEPMRAVLLGRSGFGVQAVKKPNMIGFKP